MKKKIFRERKIIFTKFAHFFSVHYRDKLTTGERLSYAGLAVAYGQKSVRYQGPRVSDYRVDYQVGSLVLEFDGRQQLIDIRSKGGFEVIYLVFIILASKYNLY